MKRRSFLSSILAAGFAPAAIGSGVLMPVRQIITPMSLAEWDAAQIALARRDLEQRYVLFVHPTVAAEIRAMGLYRNMRIVETTGLSLRTGEIERLL